MDSDVAMEPPPVDPPCEERYADEAIEIEHLFARSGGDWDAIDDGRLAHLLRRALLKSPLYAACGAERFIDTTWVDGATEALDEGIDLYRTEAVPRLAELADDVRRVADLSASSRDDAATDSECGADPADGGGSHAYGFHDHAILNSSGEEPVHEGPTSAPLDLFACARAHAYDDGGGGDDDPALFDIPESDIVAFARVPWRMRLVLKPPLIGPGSERAPVEERRARVAIAMQQFVDAVERRMYSTSRTHPYVECFDLATLSVTYAGLRESDHMPMLQCAMCYATRFI